MHQLIKEGKITIEQAINPEKHISEVDPTKLKIDVLPSGFPSLDDAMLLKANRSELIVVAGRPSHGKSAFMFQLAYNLAHNVPVHVFSMEMDQEQIFSRLVASRINKSLSHIQRGYVDEKLLIKANKEMRSLQYFIDDRAGLSVYDICDAARTTAKKRGTKVVVVDYLQLMRSKKGHSKDDEVGDITKALRELAKELKIPIIVGSQLNRACEIRGAQTGNYKPQLSDLRESGNIEQDADMVLFIHRQSRYTGERVGLADIVIAKNRNGPTTDIEMQFSEQMTSFIDREVRI